MNAVDPLFPEIDFATDDLPNLHEILAKIRATHRVAPVRYHGGSHLARRELEIAIGTLFERLPDLRLVDPESVQIL